MFRNNVLQLPSPQEFTWNISSIYRIMLVKSSISLPASPIKPTWRHSYVKCSKLSWLEVLCSSSVCRTKIIPFFPEHYQKDILKQVNGWLGLLRMVHVFIVTFQNWFQWNRALFAPLQVKFSWESRNCFRLPVYYSKEPKLLFSLYLILLSWRWILIKFVKLGNCQA